MTTNCLQDPQEGYKQHIFTAGHVGWPGIPRWLGVLALTG